MFVLYTPASYTSIRSTKEVGTHSQINKLKLRQTSIDLHRRDPPGHVPRDRNQRPFLDNVRKDNILKSISTDRRDSYSLPISFSSHRSLGGLGLQPSFCCSFSFSVRFLQLLLSFIPSLMRQSVSMNIYSSFLFICVSSSSFSLSLSVEVLFSIFPRSTEED